MRKLLRQYTSVIKTYSDASLAYQSDCNRRRLKKPDATRLRLQLAEELAFKTVMKLLEDLIQKSRAKNP